MYIFFSNLVLPRYKLRSSHVRAEAGQSALLKFSVVHDPKWGEISKHSLQKKGFENIMTPYVIEADKIVFNELSVNDRGTYTISCENNAGEGSKTFKLDVIPAKGSKLTKLFGLILYLLFQFLHNMNCNLLM